MGQAYAGMGSADPRMNVHGALDFRLTSLYRSWSCFDDPPSRVKPLPLTLLTQCVTLAHQEGTQTALAASECLVLGFFFLLRPGEYLGIPNDALDNTFRLRNVGLWIGARALDILSCPVADLQAATFGTVTFTRQKNSVRNETIGHGRSGHPHLCPVLCLVARVISLRGLQAPPSCPLNIYAVAPTRPWRHVQSGDLTRRLRNTLALFPIPGYVAADIFARSTRAGGAMALLCAGVSGERIRMVGRWRSDELYRYLHVQAQPVMTACLPPCSAAATIVWPRSNRPTLHLRSHPFLPLAELGHRLVPVLTRIQYRRLEWVARCTVKSSLPTTVALLLSLHNHTSILGLRPSERVTTEAGRARVPSKFRQNHRVDKITERYK